LRDFCFTTFKLFISYLCRMKDYSKYITIEPGKHSGQPCIRGLRITVYDVLNYLAAGDSIKDILHHFPMLKREDILATLAYVANKN
jgi:uncharacterized protein (DUF433 family)